MTGQPSLADRMRARAATAGLAGPRLVQLAGELDAATSAQGEAWSAKRLLGAWARARRAWCEVTGEPLV